LSLISPQSQSNMSFVWFWTFWHWSKESFRTGSLLRGPLHGIGGHWDEWFRHEASESDRSAIEEVGRTEAMQHHFVSWLLRYWTREAGLDGNTFIPRFVLGQLASVPPFSRWRAFEPYRTSYGVGGVSAVVLAERSPGEAGDVRSVEALTLPADADPAAPAVLSEGFQADGAELHLAHQAALSQFNGKSLVVFLALWIATGRRPYPRWLQILLGLGWGTVGGLIVWLIAGPDPDGRLFFCIAILAVLWSGLVVNGTAVAGWQSLRAWRQGRLWARQLERSQVRLRMKGGLTLKGGSAGFSFFLNTLLSLYRTQPRAARDSWLWQSFFGELNSDPDSWAATGVITPDGRVKQVVLESKLRACLQHGGILRILTPWQRGAGRTATQRLAENAAPAESPQVSSAETSVLTQVGYATELRPLQTYPCRYLGQSVMAVANLSSVWQTLINSLAVTLSVAMLLALPDFRGTLLPPPAPLAVGPSSPSPDYLWVSLDTKEPEHFLVALESNYWLNRRVEVSRHSGANGSVRAEIHLQRSAAPSTADQEDGTVWIERRYQFLGREFAPGERIGRYDLSYLNRIGHE
jgi:hypothetical protein